MVKVQKQKEEKAIWTSKGANAKSGDTKYSNNFSKSTAGNGTELSDKDKKQLFINQSKVDSFILSNQLMASVSNYEVKAGNIIPIILMTRINSDLPNNITALVREVSMAPPKVEPRRF